MDAGGDAHALRNKTKGGAGKKRTAAQQASAGKQEEVQ
jgi:hypothetical protein